MIQFSRVLSRKPYHEFILKLSNMSKKVVLKLGIQDNKEKQKAMKVVSSFTGIESLAIDMKEKKITVVGNIDPVKIVSKLRKSWHTDLLTVGPAKEPEKKEEKKEEKKDEKKGETKDPKKPEEERKEREQLAAFHYPNFNPYHCYNYNYPNYPQSQPHYRVHSYAENPNSCVIF